MKHEFSILETHTSQTESRNISSILLHETWDILKKLLIVYAESLVNGAFYCENYLTIMKQSASLFSPKNTNSLYIYIKLEPNILFI